MSSGSRARTVEVSSPTPAGVAGPQALQGAGLPELRGLLGLGVAHPPAPGPPGRALAGACGRGRTPLPGPRPSPPGAVLLHPGADAAEALGGAAGARPGPGKAG